MAFVSYFFTSNRLLPDSVHFLVLWATVILTLAGWGRKGLSRGEGTLTDLPTVHSISSEHIGYPCTCVVLSWTELKQLCLYLYSVHQCFPNLFSTATHFLERQSIATRQKKLVLKRKKILLNIILQKTPSVSHNEACVFGALVSGYCWWRHWRPRQCELFSGARSSTIAACFEIWFLFLPLPN
jgi:hypothetical protein